MTPQFFIFLGRSGCGKGTQVKFLTEFLNTKDASNGIFYVSTGEEFRKLMTGDEYSSKRVKKIVDAGIFAPSFLAVMCWANAIVKGYKENMHMITDGSPRKMAETAAFDTLGDFYGFGRPHFIYMNVSSEWATERLLGRAAKDPANARKDDTVEGIARRQAEFDRDLVPVIEYYRNNPNVAFHEINGEQPIEDVHKAIMEAVAL